MSPHVEAAGRRARLAALFGLCTVLGTAACERESPPLRVGIITWPGYEPLVLARSLGLFQGQPIQLVDFTSATEVQRAYRNGLLDVAALTADEALAAAANEDGHRIVLVCDASSGADVLLAHPEVRSLPDLKGRRVGVETTGLGAYVLARALETAGMSDADVVLVHVPLSEHELAYRTGRVDAVVTFEPHRSRLLAAGARVLFDSSQIPGEVVDVLLTRKGLSAAHERALVVLERGWLAALDYLRAHPGDAAERVSSHDGTTPEAFLASLQGLELTGREANLRLLDGGDRGLTPTLRKLSEVMFAHHITPVRLEPPSVDRHPLEAAAP